MDDFSLEDIVRQLSDLEVALFLCLVAHEHCLIETTRDGIHDLAKELALVCEKLQGFQMMAPTYMMDRSAQMPLTYLIPFWIVVRQHPLRTFTMRSSRQTLGKIKTVHHISG